MDVLRLKYTLIAFVLAAFFRLEAQVNRLDLDPKLEKMFAPYLTYRHQGPEGLEQFKREHPEEYLKELWYFSSSFYIRRDYFKEGEVLEASTIDISRFEQKRKQGEESIVVFEGYRDVLVLLPGKDLLFKP